MATSHDPGASMLHENAGAALKVFQGGAISIDGIALIKDANIPDPIIERLKTIDSIYKLSDDEFDSLFRGIREKLEADPEFTSWRARSGVKHTIETYKGRQIGERGVSFKDRDVDIRASSGASSRASSMPSLESASRASSMPSLESASGAPSVSVSGSATSGGKRRTLKKGRQAPVKKARRRTLGATRR